jgi:hypothetical protein
VSAALLFCALVAATPEASASAAATPAAAATPTADASPAASPTATPSPTPVLGPKPTTELEALQFLVEERVHEEIYHPGALPPPGKAAARSKTVWILEGHRLYIVYKSRTAGGDYEARGFFGWDSQRRLYTLDWFDNVGGARRYAGDFDPQGTLVLSAEFVFEGDPARELFSIHKQDGGKILFMIQRAIGDKAAKILLESMGSKAPPPTPTPTATPSPTGGAPATPSATSASPTVTPRPRS